MHRRTKAVDSTGSLYGYYAVSVSVSAKKTIKVKREETGRAILFGPWFEEPARGARLVTGWALIAETVFDFLIILLLLYMSKRERLSGR